MKPPFDKNSRLVQTLMLLVCAKQFTDEEAAIIVASVGLLQSHVKNDPSTVDMYIITQDLLAPGVTNVEQN